MVLYIWEFGRGGGGRHSFSLLVVIVLTCPIAKIVHVSHILQATMEPSVVIVFSHYRPKLHSYQQYGGKDPLGTSTHDDTVM